MFHLAYNIIIIYDYVFLLYTSFKVEGPFIENERGSNVYTKSAFRCFELLFYDMY